MPLVKYALIDEEGNPVGSVETGDYTTDISGQVDATGFIYQAIDFDKDISTTDAQWYYDDRPDRGWSWRPQRPSEFHEWKSKIWTLNQEQFWVRVKAQRDTKLLKSDWTQAVDAPLTAEQKEICRTYRQGLRDLTLQSLPSSELIEDIVWPTKPDFL